MLHAAEQTTSNEKNIFNPVCKDPCQSVSLASGAAFLFIMSSSLKMTSVLLKGLGHQMDCAFVDMYG
jgi:hypothetical protein